MKTVVLIDDEKSITTLIEDILFGKEFNLMTFNSSPYGLDYIKRNKPDLLLLDIMMPEIDGFQMIKLVRKIYPDLKIVVISGGFRHIEINGHDTIVNNMGADALIEKPFSPITLIDTINRFCGLSEAHLS